MNSTIFKGMRRHLVKFLLLFAVLATSLGAVQSSWALELQDAKAGGLVGETASGYLAAVSGGSGDVKALVDETNALRRKEYERIAKSNGIPLEKVEVLAGKKAIAKTPAGQYINTGGGWQKK